MELRLEVLDAAASCGAVRVQCLAGLADLMAQSVMEQLPLMLQQLGPLLSLAGAACPKP